MSASESFTIANSTQGYAPTWNLSKLWYSLRSSRISSKREPAMDGKWSKFWRINLFEGMKNDVKRRAPFYWSDWRDAWNYRVVPASVYMYFAK